MKLDVPITDFYHRLYLCFYGVPEHANTVYSRRRTVSVLSRDHRPFFQYHTVEYVLHVYTPMGDAPENPTEVGDGLVYSHYYNHSTAIGRHQKLYFNYGNVF